MFGWLEVPTNQANGMLSCVPIGCQLRGRIATVERKQQHTELSKIRGRITQRVLQSLNIRQACAGAASINRQKDNGETGEFRQLTDPAGLIGPRDACNGFSMLRRNLFDSCPKGRRIDKGDENDRQEEFHSNDVTDFVRWRSAGDYPGSSQARRGNCFESFA